MEALDASLPVRRDDLENKVVSKCSASREYLTLELIESGVVPPNRVDLGPGR